MRSVVLGGGVLASIMLGGYFLPALKPISYSTEVPGEVVAKDEDSPAVLETKPTDIRPVVTHVPLPPEVRTIYMTACVVGTRQFRDKLVALINETEINSVIIDIKDYSGTISFPSQSEIWRSAWEAARCGTADMKDFIASLHAQNIYVIGRITVFQDPHYTTKVRPDLAVKRASDGKTWHDFKGLSFIDVGARPYWDHIVELAAESYNLGFDELNFDYVRYPSDGPMSDIAFVHSANGQYGNDKQANLEAFFAYLNAELDKPERFTAVRHENTGREEATPWTSVDIFGMTTVNYDDLSIGQILERTVPYFDFTAPMVYPSHYPKTYLGLGNPNDYPYKVVFHAMDSAVKRLAAPTTILEGFTHTRIGTSTPPTYEKQSYGPEKLRTWIQDFDYGGDYDAADVRAQIQASYDAGVMSFMIWAPSNIYTRAALQAENN